MSAEKRFTLRMDEHLFNEVKRLAEKNKRSVAKEIEYLVEQQITKGNHQSSKGNE